VRIGAAFDETAKKSVSEILNIVPRNSVTSQENIDWSPTNFARLQKRTQGVLQCCWRIGCLAHNRPTRRSKGPIVRRLQRRGHDTLLFGREKICKTKSRYRQLAAKRRGIRDSRHSDVAQ